MEQRKQRRRQPGPILLHPFQRHIQRRIFPVGGQLPRDGIRRGDFLIDMDVCAGIPGDDGYAEFVRRRLLLEDGVTEVR